MGKFTNDATSVTFSVADSKDDRYGEGYTPVAEKKAPAKKVASSKSEK